MQIPLFVIRSRIRIRRWRYRLSFALRNFFQQRPRLRRLFVERKRHWQALVCLAVLAIVFLNSALGPHASAKTLSLTSNDILNGKTDYNQIQLNSTASAFSLQNGNIGQWHGGDGLEAPPSMVYGDSTLVYGPNNGLYMMTYFAGCHFYRFDMETQTWTTLQTPSVGCGSGTVLVYDSNGAFYYLPGGNSAAFFKYDVDGDSWSQLASVPALVGTGASGAYVTVNSAPTVYVARGNSSAALYAYSIATNTWTAKSSFPSTQGTDLGISIAWDGSNSLYAVTNNHGEFKKYSIASDTWANLAAQPNMGNRREALIWANNRIYAAPVIYSGNDAHDFVTYDPGTNAWASQAATPSGEYRNFRPPLAYDGSDSIYSIFGAADVPMLYKYSISQNSWDQYSLFNQISSGNPQHMEMMYDGNHTAYYMGATGSGSRAGVYQIDTQTGAASQIGSQIGTDTGLAGVYKNGALYLMGVNNNQFQKYDLATNSWTTLPNEPTNSLLGAGIIDGGDGYLYAVFGNGSNLFYRYSDAGGWQALTVLPVGINLTSGITRMGSSIYVMAGNSTAYLMKYNMTTPGWTTAFTPSGALHYGSMLIGDGSRYLYADLGTFSDPGARHMFRLDTTNNTWLRLADTPQATRAYGSGFYDTTNNRLYVAQGYDTSHMWYWTPTATSYQTTGTWYSGTLDLKNVQAWQSLTYSSPGSGTVTVYTRTSAQGGLWSAWQAVSGSTVNSPANRYVQFKFVLSGDGSATPTVSNIALQYTQDTTPPNLPSQFTAAGTSVSGAEQLVSGTTYAYEHPYFTWNGANDGSGGSGVAGYYVYFGTDSNADPTTDGSYQTASNYTVTTPMTAGGIYYVRLAVKDKQGNVSPPVTYFSYRYFYISPPGSTLESTPTDFSSGTNVGVDISSDGMKLVQQSGGAWSVGTQKQLPASSYGGAEAVVNNSLYVLRGSSSSTFWQYDLTAGTWNTLANIPSTVSLGSALSWDGGNYIYAIAGNGTSAFYRYNIQNDVWETLPNLPDFAQSGTDMKYIGNGNFAIIFAGVAEFYFYNSQSGVFTSKTSGPQVISTNAGSGIWYDGQDTIYAYFGGYDQFQSGRKSMAAYSIAQDTWHQLSQPPFDAFYAENNLVGDASGHLYLFANDYAANQSMTNTAEEYDIASDTWKTLPNVSTQDIRGTAASDGSRYIYIIPSVGSGPDSRRITRYDTWNDTISPQDPNLSSWQRVTNSLQNAWNWQAGNASTMAYDGIDTVYAIGGDDGNWSEFLSYSLSKKSATYLPPPPFVGLGGSLTYSGGALYYMPARNTNSFYRYDFNSQSWLAMATIPTNAYRPGSGDLMAGPSGALYALTGNNKQLYKYVPDSGQGVWTRLADIPAATVLYGAAAYDGSNYIYALVGNNTGLFYRYDITANSWSTLTAMPTVTNNGGATLLFNNGKIYATVGNSTSNSYIYDTTLGTWTAGSTTPEAFRAGGQAISIGGQYGLAFGGDNSPDFWRFQFPSSSTAYNGLATHISPVLSMQGLFDYAGIQAQVNQPSNTGIEFYTRTSPDGTTWDDWVIADQVKSFSTSESMRIASKPQKFIQVKVVLSSFDNKNTPTVSNYSVDYYFDTQPPNNPTQLTAYSDNTKQTTLTSNTWQNVAKPYIEWPNPGQPGGATDGPLGSNIKGYWVYVGTDPTAVPQTAGVFVTSANYTPNLTTSGTYYVRIQAVDMTGNVDSNVFSPYIYKFDNVPPTNPAFITVTPSGFTSTNNYTFQWPNGFDADSGISGYCYHSGALTGPLAVETCQQGLSLSNLSAAYRSGTNVFYIRTLDNAGNYASSYITVSFYYSTDPPTPVTNFRAIPPVSTQNLFAYTWDLPASYSGDPDQLQYCYSVNVLPSPLNTTCGKDKFIAPFKAATQQGTNIIYMVAKDEAGNVNWNNYASTNFIANTVSPGIPLNLVVGDTSDQASGRWSLTLTWSAPTFVGNGVASYIVQRSDDGHTFTDLGQVSNTAYVDLSVVTGQVYYYRVLAADNVGNRGGASATVSDSAVGNYSSPPQIVAAPTVQASFSQAKVSWVTARDATSFVYYGTSPTNLTQSIGVLDLTTEHNITVTGLQPSTIYYYKVQSFDSARDYNLSDAYSQLYTFSTTAAAQIFGVQTSNISLSSATISWQTSVPTSAQVQYGTDVSYGYSQTDGSGLTTNHSFQLSSLASGTQYHFRISATAAEGSVVRSDDYSVTTIPRPTITNVRFQPLADEATIAADVTWDTNVPTSSDILYKTLGAQQEASTAALVEHHQMTLTNLAGNSDYTFVISGRDQYGNLTETSNQTWHSQVDTRAPTISGMSVTSSTMDVLNGAKAQLIITWKTDEPATTQISYDVAGSKKLHHSSPFDPEPTTTHVVVLSGLDLASVYRIQPVSRDISGNTAFGGQLATVTPDQQQSVLDNVLNVLQKVFRL